MSVYQTYFSFIPCVFLVKMPVNLISYLETKLVRLLHSNGYSSGRYRCRFLIYICKSIEIPALGNHQGCRHLFRCHGIFFRGYLNSCCLYQLSAIFRPDTFCFFNTYPAFKINLGFIVLYPVKCPIRYILYSSD